MPFNTYSTDYPNFAELQEFIKRAVDYVISENTSLFANTQVELLETDFVLEKQQTINTLIIVECQFNEGVLKDQQIRYQWNKQVYEVPTFIKIRSKNEAGVQKRIYEMTRYLKLALTRNSNNTATGAQTAFTSLLTTAQGWTGTTYATNFDSNYDLLDEPVLPEIIPDSQYWFYEFKILFAVYKA